VTEPEWLDLDIVLDVHAEQLALFGGADGIRDVGLLESALSRAVNKFAYGELELAALPVRSYSQVFRTSLSSRAPRCNA